MNKDLKLHFGQLQRQVENFEESGLLPQQRSRGHRDGQRKKQRYNSSDEDFEDEFADHKKAWDVKNNGSNVNSNYFKHVVRGSTQESDKENHRSSNRVIKDFGGMASIQESQGEDRSYRKRQNMLSDIQSMIKDYKQKAQYSNLVAHHEDHNLAATIQTTIDAEEMPVPASRLTYRTGDSFNISGTSRSNSRSRSRTFAETGLTRSRQLSASRRSDSRSKSRTKMSIPRSNHSGSSRKGRVKSPFAPSRAKRNSSIESGDPYDVIS